MDDSILVQNTISGINTFTRDNDWAFLESYYECEKIAVSGDRLIYLFKSDDLGPATASFVDTFCKCNNYFSLSIKDSIFVCDSECSPSGAQFFILNYVDKVGYPSDKLGLYWDSSETTSGDDSGEDVPGEDTGDITGDDPGDEYDDFIDNFDELEIKEMLEEIYKDNFQYHRDMYEVQQNSFDVSIVSLTLNFVLVFLCGILVGCAFAKTLWHKMNLG